MLERPMAANATYLEDGAVVRKQQMLEYWLRLEMPSEAKIQGRSGGMPDRGRPAQDVL
jgi:hypothetical protein